MKVCSKCNETENDNDERFCISCGMDMDSISLYNTSEEPIDSTPDESTKTVYHNSIKRLILADKTIMTIDDSKRLIGRADLRMYTKMNPSLISRLHFAIYSKDAKCMINDCVASVQNTHSKTETFLNGERLVGEMELKNGDIIRVSDIKMTFEA